MSKISRKVNIMLFALMALFVWSGSALAGYSITDLGTLGGSSYVTGSSINDQGRGAAFLSLEIGGDPTLAGISAVVENAYS